MTTDRKALDILGLARRAAKVACGAGAVQDAIRTGRACALVLARDAAPNTADKARALARTRNLPEFSVGSKSELGRRFGRDEVAVLCLLDKSFLSALKRCVAASTTPDASSAR